MYGSLKAQNIIERLLAMTLSDEQKLEILDRRSHSMSDTNCDHTLPSRCQAQPCGRWPSTAMSTLVLQLPA
jgi:hypothetical protein